MTYSKSSSHKQETMNHTILSTLPVSHYIIIHNPHIRSNQKHISRSAITVSRQKYKIR